MRKICCIMLLVLGLCPFWASIAKADGPATRPSVSVLPFDVVGESGHAWVGKAMQEALATSLHGSENATASTGIVVSGSIQFVNNDQMRVLAHVYDADHSQSLGDATCDANLKDLFNAEDILTTQAQHAIYPHRAAMSGPKPAINIVGPTVSATPPSYFDGNLQASLQIPDRYRDDYDRNAYHPTNWCDFYNFPCGSCFSGFGGFGGGCFGGASPGAGPPPAVSGW